MTPVAENVQFRALTGIRALSMYMVFLHHHGHDLPAGPWSIVHRLLDQFYAGLVLFFVLSGFLIAYRYAGMEPSEVRRYLVRRCARVIPLYLLLTTLTYAVFLCTDPRPWTVLLAEYLANITFIKGWFDDLKFTGILQAWSLTVEWTFYLLAPWLFVLIRRWRWYLIVLPIGFIGVGLAAVAICGDDAPFGFMRSNVFLFACTFLGRCPEFFVGIALALLLRRYGQRSPTRHATLIGAVVIMVLLATASVLEVDYAQPEGVLIIGTLLPVFGVAPLFWGLMTENTWAARMLGSPVAVLLGRTSYAFFLLHLGVVFTAIQSFTSNGIVTFVVLSALAWSLFRFVEEPLNAYVKRRWSPSPR
jgi:peptidoglycan/LPS O-acetylase OafA/YrhL